MDTQAYRQTKWRKESVACCGDNMKKAAYQKDHKGCEDVMRENRFGSLSRNRVAYFRGKAKGLKKIDDNEK